MKSKKKNKQSKSYTVLHGRLFAWYRREGRHDLPWRNTRDPYAIYLSEVMLQQTQVKTVLERFYFPFMQQFPTLQALSEASAEQVVKAWEGLGYYSRAHHLHRAAQIAAPALPQTVAELEALPGIGRNTAHAVAAFAYGKAVPVLEANVKRILRRFFALEEARDPALWEYAEQLLDAENPFDYNQAMMDIGAMVCTARKPLCQECPLSEECKGQANPEAYAALKKSKPQSQKPIRKQHLIIWPNGEKELRLKRRQTRLLHGMYGFDEYEVQGIPNDWKRGVCLGEVIHHYSHFTLQAEVILLTWKAQKQAVPMAEGGEWHALDSIRQLPLSGADKKALQLWCEHDQK